MHLWNNDQELPCSLSRLQFLLMSFWSISLLVRTMCFSDRIHMRNSGFCQPLFQFYEIILHQCLSILFSFLSLILPLITSALMFDYSIIAVYCRVISRMIQVFRFGATLSRLKLVQGAIGIEGSVDQARIHFRVTLYFLKFIPSW